MHRDSSQLDDEEKTKRRLYAKYERRKQRQTERHVLRREMAGHAIPQLFVSQRSDKNPNGFNCAICQKDISFLSRGEPEIWRHFSRKSHYLKDRRYRLDHEDVIYTSQFDPVKVADISSELRAEIEQTPPVVLGKKNPFREDEVDALVGVVSNVPSATLVGGLFELLRSGGSHSFLRRLWNQFRVTIPVESSYAQATWSKTESLVIVCQTLYPRVLRRVYSWCKDSPFSILFREEDEGVCCIVRCCVGSHVREVTLLWEPYSSGICDAEILCLSRVLATLPETHSPVVLLGCSPTLFNVFSEWCRARDRSVPLSLLEYSPSVFKSHVREAGMVGAHSLDPFAVLDFLVLQFNKAVYQPWMLGLVELRQCVRKREIPFSVLGAVLEELVDHWEDVKLVLKESGATAPPRGKTPVDLGQLIVSDSYVLPRLSLLHVLVSCFQSNFEKQGDESVTDYSCRNYAEFCFFYWSLLGKVKKLSELPRIEEWSLYIGRPLCTWSNVAYVDCLRSEPIVLKALQGCSDAAKRNFLRECHGFLMEFLKVLNVSSYSTSLLASSLSCLSPDMLLQGDEAYTVSLFRELVSCLQACGRLSSVEAEGASNEFKSLLVDLRRKNRRVVTTIKNSFSFLHESGLLGCRVHLTKVIALVSVGVVPRAARYARVEMSLSGSSVPKKILLSSILSLQSYVSDGAFVSGELLTKDCLDELKANLPVGHVFMSNASFSPWRPLYLQSHQDLYRDLRERFNGYYMGQVADWRRRAGLGVLSSGSPINSSPAVAPASVSAEVEVPVSCSTSKVGFGSGVPVASAKSLVSASGASSVSQKLQEKKAGRRGASTSAITTKGHSSKKSAPGGSK